jgi:hypothetical protein
MKIVKSKTKGMSFGNVLAGVIIGAGVDMGDGAAYDYPTEIVVPVKRAAKLEQSDAGGLADKTQ